MGLSGLLVVLAAWRQPTTWLRLMLWVLFVVFAASTLLAEQWPVLEKVQLVASVGIIGGHTLNQRQRRCCPAKFPSGSFLR